jgi:hypothetical protein
MGATFRARLASTSSSVASACVDSTGAACSSPIPRPKSLVYFASPLVCKPRSVSGTRCGASHILTVVLLQHCFQASPLQEGVYKNPAWFAQVERALWHKAKQVRVPGFILRGQGPCHEVHAVLLNTLMRRCCDAGVVRVGHCALRDSWVSQIACRVQQALQPRRQGGLPCQQRGDALQQETLRCRPIEGLCASVCVQATEVGLHPALAEVGYAAHL